MMNGREKAVLLLPNTGVTPGSYVLASITVDAKGRVTIATGASTTGSGAVVLASSPTIATPALTGYLEIANSSAPSTPTTASRLFIDASNRLSWKGTNGFVRTFDGTANTADRIYVLPDAAGTVVLDTATQTLTNKSMNAAQLTGTVAVAQLNNAAILAPVASTRNVIQPTAAGVKPVVIKSYADVYAVTNKALTSNVATLTIGTHSLVVGQIVTVAGVDATFNSTAQLTAVAATTISYNKIASDVASVAASGTVTGNQSANFLDIQSQSGTVWGGFGPNGNFSAGGPNAIPQTAVAGYFLRGTSTNNNDAAVRGELGIPGDHSNMVAGVFQIDLNGTINRSLALAPAAAKAFIFATDNVGVATIARGLVAGAQIRTGASIASLYDLHVAEVVLNGTGAVTNHYGLYIDALALAGTLNYAIFTNAGLVNFGDQVAIIGSANRVQGIVRGFSTQTNDIFQVQRNSGSAVVLAVTDAGLTTLTARDAATAAVTDVAIFDHTGGTSADGFGTGLLVRGKDSTTASINMAAIRSRYTTAAHLTAKTQTDYINYDAAQVARVAMSTGANGTVPLWGVFGSCAIQQATTGTSTGFTAGSGTAVKDDSTFTGGTGSTAYRISDIVLALKNSGQIAA